MKKCIFLFCLFFLPLLAQNEKLIFEEARKRTIWCFQEHEQTIEAAVSLLYLTSTLSSPYSDELLSLNMDTFPLFTSVFNSKVDAINPNYNAGFSAELRYHIPSSNHILDFHYSYIHNDGKGRLKRDNQTIGSDGTVQRNIQNDRGHQHFHLHTIDLLIRHFYHFSSTAALSISTGTSFSDLHFHFSVRNYDQIFNSSISSSTIPISTQLQLRGNRKFCLWGIGPKVAIGFNYGFLPLTWSHDLSFNASMGISIQYSKKWGRGNFHCLGQQQGDTLTRVNLGRNWEDKPEFKLTPNITFDSSLSYRYCSSNNLIFGLSIGFRLYTYWDIYDLNRELSYQMEKVQPVSPIQLREEDSAGFFGPHFSLKLEY